MPRKTYTLRKEDGNFLRLDEYPLVRTINEQDFLINLDSIQLLTRYNIGTRDPKVLFGLANGERLTPEQLKNVTYRDNCWYISDTNICIYTYHQLRYRYLKITKGGEDYYLLPQDYKNIVRGQGEDANNYYFNKMLVTILTHLPCPVDKNPDIKPVSFVQNGQYEKSMNEARSATSTINSVRSATSFPKARKLPQDDLDILFMDNQLPDNNLASQHKPTKANPATVDIAKIPPKKSYNPNYHSYTGHKRSLNLSRLIPQPCPF